MPFQKHTLAPARCLLVILLSAASDGLAQTSNSPPPPPDALASTAAITATSHAARQHSVLVNRNRSAAKNLRANGGQPLPPPSPTMDPRTPPMQSSESQSPDESHPPLRVAKLKPTPPSIQASANSASRRKTSEVVPIPITPDDVASLGIASPSDIQQASFHSSPGHIGQTGTCCCNLHCTCEKYVVPLGASVNAWTEAHIYAGWQAQYVMYHYDFFSGPNEDHTQLKPAGRRKLTRLIDRAAPWERIVVQPVEGNPNLSQARKSSVIQFLVSLGTQVSDSQVVVAEPEYLGLKGVEAVIIDGMQLQSLQRNIGGTQSFGGQSQGNQGFSGSSSLGAGR